MSYIQQGLHLGNFPRLAHHQLYMAQELDPCMHLHLQVELEAPNNVVQLLVQLLHLPNGFAAKDGLAQQGALCKQKDTIWQLFFEGCP